MAGLLSQVAAEVAANEDAGMNVMPTLADLARARAPDRIDGLSIAPTLLGEVAAGHQQESHEFMYWEFEGQTAVRMGQWKGYRPAAGEPFELYDLESDLEEEHDVASRFPDTVARMAEYAKEAHTENLKGGWPTTYAVRSWH